MKLPIVGMEAIWQSMGPSSAMRPLSIILVEAELVVQFLVSLYLMHSQQIFGALMHGSVDIGNPISLAKVILQRSNTPLSLRRVPPNLLMGDGAKEFARESGIPLIRNEFLVSRNARDRFFRWQEELRRAESQRSPSTSPESYTQASDIDYDNKIRQAAQRDHTNAILTGTWNEGQPDSPGSPWRSPTYLPGTYSGSPPSPPPTSLLPPATTLVHGMRNLYDPSHPRPKPWLGKESTPSSRFPPFIGGQNNESFKSDPSTSASNDTTSVAPHDGACSNDFPTPLTLQIEDTPTTTATSHYVGDQQSPRTIGSHQNEDEDDNITDTVGAIAIDQSGRIAAGSSSGGIGMKHRGRIGPAALVGIGTAVIPADEHDPDGIAVAAVTSGTGEHMATTMASQKCAERIYQSTRRGPRGKDIDEDDESLVLEGFIINDFQEHPGVKQSTSAGAIGVMAVKKSSKGYYLYFAHNTDSFALASMSSNDREPACVMSRNSIGSTGYANGIAQGARKIHI